MIFNNKKINLILILAIITSLLSSASMSITAEAAIIKSQIIGTEGAKSSREINEKKVRRALENKIVYEKLKSYDLSKKEIESKIDKMNDEQIHQLAILSDKLTAGGDGLATAAVLVLVVFVIVLLFLMVTKRI